jgi:hypothetical protein
MENASNSDADFSDWLYKTLSNKAYDPHWDGLRQILKRSYLSRLWVIQELVVTDRPDEVWLLCGSRKTRFTYLRMVSRQIDLFDGKIPTFYDSQTVDATIVELRELGQRVSDITVHMRAWGSPNHGERDVGILRLVRRCRDLFCAEPRDKL